MRPVLPASRRPAAFLLLTAAALVTAGCGFNLRGSAPVPNTLAPLAIQCEEGVPRALCQTLTEQLRLGGVALVDRNQADYLLQVNKFNEQRRASSITQQGTAAEFVLRQSVAISVLTADETPLVANSEVSSSQTFRFDENNVLAKRREETSIRKMLYQRLSQQVIFRLAPLTDDKIRTLRQEAASQENSSGQAGESGSQQER